LSVHSRVTGSLRTTNRGRRANGSCSWKTTRHTRDASGARNERNDVLWC
jgi:hypothetical protein